jgi:hypothetical protein
MVVVVAATAGEVVVVVFWNVFAENLYFYLFVHQ